MDGYVSKPIRDVDLFSVIDKLASKPQKTKQTRHFSGTQDTDLSTQSVFDLSKAMKSVNGDRALFHEIAALFLESAADSMEKIRQAILKSDASVVEDAAHSLKGSVANFGAKRAFDAACRLERIGREGKLTEAESAHLELKRELDALQSAMETAMVE